MKKDVALGIDIGGTNTAFGFIDREGNYLTEGNIPTAKHEDINDYLKELYLEIEKVLDPIRQEVNFVGIGIGAPNGNYSKGAIEPALARCHSFVRYDERILSRTAGLSEQRRQSCSYR